MKVFRQKGGQCRQIALPLSEEAFACLRELRKGFIVAVIHNLLLEKLPIALDQIQIRRIRRQKYQFDLRAHQRFGQYVRTVIPGVIDNDINRVGFRMFRCDFGEQI